MKRVFLLLALALVLTLSVVPARAITWGVLDNGAHPNVGIMGIFDELGDPIGFCSCTLIDVNVALTAGHCIEYVLSLGDVVTVVVSFDEDPFEANWISVEDVIPHPNYNWGPTSNPHDVGLLILDEEVTEISPAMLPYEGFLDDLRADGQLRQGPNKAQFTVVGFGATLTWPPPVIDFLPHPRQNAQSEFRALLKAWLCLSQNQATDDGGTCFGDSGGPVFWTDSNGNEILVGITSWGDPHCISPSFNYRVDIPETLSFINNGE